MKEKIYDTFTAVTGEQPMKEKIVECEKSFQPIVQYSFNENYVRWLESRIFKIEKFIEDACNNEIDDCNKAVNEVTDGSEQIFEGRREYAEYILRCKDKGWYLDNDTNANQLELDIEK
tara:strand:+ start:4456 stop:4809 length:354 start_codon:yes stop_codon:yes gene_type:complete